MRLGKIGKGGQSRSFGVQRSRFDLNPTLAPARRPIGKAGVRGARRVKRLIRAKGWHRMWV